MTHSNRFSRASLLPVLYAVLIVLALHLLFMGLAGQHFSDTNDYNSFSLQAAAWLEGRLDLGRDYPWLELAIFKDRYYVSFPPFPSYVLLPFVLLTGVQTPDMLLSLLCTLTGTAYAARLAARCGCSRRSVILLPVFLYCGTAVWQITVNGWVWFFAQNLALTLTLASLFHALEGKKGRSLFLLVAAVGCRPFQIFAFPLVLWLLYRETPGAAPLKRWKALLFGQFYRWLPAILLALSFLWLNYARFGDPIEFGHNYLPEFTREEYGQFHLSYLIRNFPLLFRLPTLDPVSHRLVFPMFSGMNIFLAFPILVWYLWVLGHALARHRDRFVLYLNAAVLALSCGQITCYLLHRTMGGHHYGNRYVGDVLPMIFLGLCLLSQQKKAPSCEQRKPFSDFLFVFLLLSGGLLSISGVLQYLGVY